MIRGDRLFDSLTMSPRTPTFWSGKARPSV
jgi:hypothetical protein